MDSRTVLTLTRRFQARVATVGERVATITARHWLTVGHDEADIAIFERVAGPSLQAAKTGAVQIAAGFYSTLVGRRPVAIRAAEITLEPNFREPFIAYWQALGNGHPLDEAIASGAARAEAIARNLTVSSSRRTGDVVLRRHGLRAGDWTRTTDGNACDWCELVADQTYSSAEAADFGHDRCNCSAVPNIA